MHRYFFHTYLYMHVRIWVRSNPRSDSFHVTFFSAFGNSKWNLSTFRLSCFSTFRNSKRSLSTFRFFSTFRNSVWNLSTFRFFYVSKFSMKPFHFSTFWLFEIDFAYFLIGTMQLIPTQLPPPCPPHRAWTERGRTWVSLVSRHTEPEVSPSQKYFGNTLWWFNSSPWKDPPIFNR